MLAFAGRGVVPSAAGSGGTGATPGLDVVANNMVADKKRKRLYVTVGGSAQRLPNRLVTIDPIANQIIHDTAIGSEPTTMAISDDASTLWVSLTGAAALRRVDLTGDEPVAGDQFSLPSVCVGEPCVADDMVVLPNTTGSVVATLRRRGSKGTFVVMALDDGVARPMRIGSASTPSVLALGPAGSVWGFDGEDTSFDFSVFSVDATGLAVKTFPGLISGMYTDIAYADGLVFASSGDVVDVSSPTLPVRAGTFQQQGAVLALSTHGEALMFSFMAGLGQSSTTLFVNKLHVDTFSVNRVMTMRLNLPIAPGQSVQIRDLVALGDRVAFLTGRPGEPSNVYIVTSVPGLDP
jgi:hypothetical protein